MFTLTARRTIAVAISALCLSGIAGTVQAPAAHAGTNDDSIMPLLDSHVALTGSDGGVSDLSAQTSRVSGTAIFRYTGDVSPVAGTNDDSI